MKSFITNFKCTKILILSVFVFVGNHVFGVYDLTVSLDSVSSNDTIVYCSGVNSIELISPTGSTNVMWFMNSYSDTIYTSNLILEDGINTVIRCHYMDGQYKSINFFILPFVVDAGEDLTGTCETDIPLNVSSNLNSSKIGSYQWSPSQNISDTTIPNPFVTITGDSKYYITATSLDGCKAMDSLNISITPLDVPEICLVGVNNDNKNIIIWAKSDQSDIDSVTIYKETYLTDQYEKIGRINYLESNIYIDTLSNPGIQSNKYKISFIDACGMETEASVPHKTLHLSINQGQNNIWNLIWEPYEGFSVSTYYIYRGTNKDSLELIGTSPASNTQYSDLSAPKSSVYYQIEVVSPHDCNIIKSTSSSVSRSNIVSIEIAGNKNIYSKNSQFFEISPNPCRDQMSIMLNDINTDNIIKIIALNGETLKEERLTSVNSMIDISDLKSGIYFVKVINSNESYSKKIIKM